MNHGSFKWYCILHSEALKHPAEHQEWRYSEVRSKGST